MRLVIEYCGQCGYERRAKALASRLEAAFRLPVTLVESGGGLFEVTLEGRCLFSRKETGRFPTEDEVVDAVEAVLG